MGNTSCCQATQPSLSFQQEIIKPDKKQPSFQSTISQFINGFPQLKKALDEANPFQKQDQLNNKNSLLRKFKLDQGVYVGRVSGDPIKRQGFGIMLYQQNHAYYQGFWQNDMKTGKGILVQQAGEYYSGQWSRGLPHGFGIYSNPYLKYRYKGNWFEGTKNGYGEQIFLNGITYFGNYQFGEKNGYGRLIYEDGSEYQGQLKGSKPEGLGCYKSKGIVLQGSWKAGKIHGEGSCVWYNRNNQIQGRYIGQYNEGNKQGYGQYTDSSGVIYKGMWINGQRNDYAPFEIVNTRSSVAFL